MEYSLSRGLLLCAGLAASLVIIGDTARAETVLANDLVSLQVNGGDANNGLVPFDGYFRYTDLAASEETTWSIDPVLIGPDGGVSVLSDGLLSTAEPSGGGALSTATAGGIEVEALTELEGRNAKTTFSFSSATGLSGSTFLYYAENDLFSFSGDTAAFTGSIAAGDLELFMYDSLAVSGGAPGLTVSIDGVGGDGAELSLFGSGIWTGFGETLEGGDLSVLSSDGTNFVEGPGDLGLALAFSLSGTEGTAVVNYQTLTELPPNVVTSDPSPVVPAPIPVPASLSVLLSGLLALGFAGRRFMRA